MSESPVACFCNACQLVDMRSQRDGAYHERNMLVAALSRLYPSHLALHPDDPDWDSEWRNIVCVHAPCGQMTWHIHDSELPLFEHLVEQERQHGAIANDWDGHTTAEKYERLANLGVR